MPRISKPQDKQNAKITQNLDWNDFVSDIIMGKYALLIGSEVMLKKSSDCGYGDSTRSILDCIMEDLKATQVLGPDFRCDTFTELAIRCGRSDIREEIIRSLEDGPLKTYECLIEDMSEELTRLLRTKFFRVVMTTTFDPYLENLMRSIWGDNLRILNIYDDTNCDISANEQCSDEFDIKPTLYYICGKVNKRGKKFVATENDAIEVVARWFSNKAPKNFLSYLHTKGLISLGCKFDNWLFRFFWYILRAGDIVDSSLKDTVAISFNDQSESDQKLKEYLQHRNVYTAPNAHDFINNIVEKIESCRTQITEANSSPGGVFISYAHEDLSIAASIVGKLKSKGIKVWFDAQKLGGGDEYDQRIIKAINNCKFFVPILSSQVKKDLLNNTNSRYYMNVEWALANQLKNNIGNNDFHIVPIAVSGYDPTCDYHQKTPFCKLHVINLMTTPLYKFISNIKETI